ncbi:MAG: thioredoxin-disulfide reductase [Candidatus Schekmanbacteria bacterium]|nr:thioredoxin-disulfide reductase [Candidatus Schekmanbacteria bacterium]
MEQLYDVVIIGAGPGGLTAGIYTGRAGLKTLLLEKGFAGGQMMTTYLIENYPGFPDGISGMELTSLMQKQVEKLGIPITNLEITKIAPQDDRSFILHHSEGEIRTRAMIIASGAQARLLGVPGEDRLKGRGVSYCATCDGAFFKNEHLIVAGGGNSAIEEAGYLTHFASQVTVVHRRHQLRAEKMIQEKAFKNPKINFIWDSVITEISGTQQVESVQIKNVKSGETSRIDAGGVFVFVGMNPNTNFLNNLIPLDEDGFIITDEKMATGIPGIYAAGDVRSKDVRQIASAVGDGAIAGVMVEKYLE